MFLTLTILGYQNFTSSDLSALNGNGLKEFNETEEKLLHKKRIQKINLNRKSLERINADRAIKCLAHLLDSIIFDSEIEFSDSMEDLFGLPMMHLDPLLLLQVEEFNCPKAELRIYKHILQ